MYKIIVIVGPTCSGKTDLSIEVAKRIGSEIVSADSLQIYKEFSICTSKPTEYQMNLVKHHLIGHVHVSSEYSVFKFLTEASEIIEKISLLGKVPVIVGGTGLWIDALVNNFQLETFKCNHEIFNNNMDLYEELKKVDPVSAENINKNDHKRISHALSFFKTFGFSISEQKNKTLKSEKKYEVLKIGLNFKDRNLLYDRINKRVDKMIENGLLDEIKKVKEMNLSKTSSAAIGYKEFLPYFDGKISLNDAISNVKRQTRRYAKRQITWFKRCHITKWFFLDEIENYEVIISKIFELKFNEQNEL